MTAPLTVVNQAAMTVWWGQLNKEPWKRMMNLIYSTVNSTGRILNDQNFYEFLYLGDFGPLYNEENFCRSFFQHCDDEK